MENSVKAKKAVEKSRIRWLRGSRSGVDGSDIPGGVA